MPRKRSRMTRISALAATAAMGMAALPAAASAAVCDPGPTSPVFAGFGDVSEYYLAPGGSFETSEWSLSTKARIVDTADPFELTGANDTKSLFLSDEGAATSPRFCVTSDHPHLRVVAKGSRKDLNVRVRMHNERGEHMSTTYSTISRYDHAVWTPSVNVGLPAVNLGAGETGYAEVRLYTEGSWQIDDVFVDPVRRG